MSVMSRKISVTFDRRLLLGRYVFAGFLVVESTVKTGRNSSILIRTILVFSFIMH